MNKIDDLINKLCPNGVEYKNLSELTSVITKGTTPTSIGYNFENSGVNFIKIESLDINGNFDKSKFAYITSECHDKLERSKLQENDILFSIAGAIGRIAIVNKDILPANTNQALAIIRLNSPDVLVKYVAYALKTKDAEERYMSKKVGAAQPNVSLKNISELRIAIPPLEIQKEIVRILDDFTMLSEELSSELEARKKQFKYYLHNLLDIKDGKEMTIGDIYDFKYGTGNTIPEGGGEYPVYGSNGMVGYYSEYNSEDAPVIGHIGAYAGIVNWAKGKHFVTYNGVICKHKNIDVNKKYAYYILLTQDFIGEQKGAQPFVSYDALKKPIVRIPELKEQERIVNILDAFDKLCNDILDGLPAEIEARKKQFEYYRDKLLTFKELASEVQ